MIQGGNCTSSNSQGIASPRSRSRAAWRWSGSLSPSIVVCTLSHAPSASFLADINLHAMCSPSEKKSLALDIVWQGRKEQKVSVGCIFTKLRRALYHQHLFSLSFTGAFVLINFLLTLQVLILIQSFDYTRVDSFTQWVRKLSAHKLFIRVISHHRLKITICKCQLVTGYM